MSGDADILAFLAELEREHIALVRLRGKPESGAAELERDYRALKDANRRRLAAAGTEGRPFPLGRLFGVYGLDEFEQEVLGLLFSLHAGTALRKAWKRRRGASSERATVGDVLSLLCEGARDRLDRRRYFAAGAPLVAGDLVRLDGARGEWETPNILEQGISIQSRFAQYILGDANTYADRAGMIWRDRPQVPWERVVLPAKAKDRVRELVEGFPAYLRRLKETGLEETIGYGMGLTFLFHGPSGTGKTLLARAVASYLECELLVLDVSRLVEARSEEEGIRYFLREARLSGAVAFLDECESLLDSRRDLSRILLMELERTPCLTILAANSIRKFDPALERRVTMRVEFRMPGAEERLEIWRQLVPPGVDLDPGIRVEDLARAYPCSGGGIKNILCMAAQAAARRPGERVSLTRSDLETAAQTLDEGSFLEMWTLVPPQAEESPRSGRADPALDRLERVLKACYGVRGRNLKILLGTDAPSRTLEKIMAMAGRLGIGLASAGADRLLAASGKAFRYEEEEWEEWEERRPREAFDHPALLDRLCCVQATEALNKHLSGSECESGPVKRLLRSLDRFPGAVILLAAVNRVHPECRRLFHLRLDARSSGAEDRLAAWEAQRALGYAFKRKDLEPYARYALSEDDIPAAVRGAWLRSHASGHKGVIRDAHIEEAVEALRQRVPGAPVLFGGG